MLKKLKSFFGFPININAIKAQNNEILNEIESFKLLIGKQLALENCKKDKFAYIHEAEFKVFSQFGDDGIIQYLIDRIKIKNKIFIEFGVENYKESNTRFLLLNNNWKGLIIDGSSDHISYIKNDNIYWRYDLTAVCKFITKENINTILTENNFTVDIGILSIDVDGNDYWIWENINTVNPEIVIVEYNSVFGKDKAVSIPYISDFYRTNQHYSNLYWGVSLAALNHLAGIKGYSYIGCNSNGNNAYFVRNDKMENLSSISADEGFVRSSFRESRDKTGNLNFIPKEEQLNKIQECLLIDVVTNKTDTIKNIYNLN